MVRALRVATAHELYACPLCAHARVATLRCALPRRYVMPHKEGVYEFKCTVVGHEGMKGVLEVVA